VRLLVVVGAKPRTAWRGDRVGDREQGSKPMLKIWVAEVMIYGKDFTQWTETA